MRACWTRTSTSFDYQVSSFGGFFRERSISDYTLENWRLEPKNHPIEKGKSSSKAPLWGGVNQIIATGGRQLSGANILVKFGSSPNLQVTFQPKVGKAYVFQRHHFSGVFPVKLWGSTRTVLADLVLQIDFVVWTKQLWIVAEEDQPQLAYSTGGYSCLLRLRFT